MITNSYYSNQLLRSITHTFYIYFFINDNTSQCLVFTNEKRIANNLRKLFDDNKPRKWRHDAASATKRCSGDEGRREFANEEKPVEVA